MITFSCLLLIIACNQQTDFVPEYMQNYPNLAGSKLELDSSLINLNKKDEEINLTSSRYKIICVGYCDCSPCVARLIDCENFLQSNKDFQKKIDVFFIVFSQKSEYFDYQLEHNNFSFPVLYDSTFSFLIKNDLGNHDKSVFLVNKKNEIVLVGSPFDNRVIEKYYKQSVK